MKILSLPIFSILLLCTISLYAEDTYINNADDICYEQPTSSGTFCVDIGICSGGLNCTNTYTLKNIGTSTLTNVKAIYDESGLGGSFSSSCGVTPSGSCSAQSNIDLGPFGFLGKTSVFTLSNPISAGSDKNSISAKNFIAGSCFNGENLYATYTKNNQEYRGVLQPCASESHGSRNFELRHQENLFGDVKVLGNTVLCLLDKNGQCKEPTGTAQNARLNLQKAPLSNSTLNMPKDSSVIYARLYWQGRQRNKNKWDTASKNLATTIKLKKQNNSWQEFHADILDTNSYSSIPVYSASAIVTDYIKANGNGTYSIDTKDFYTLEGETATNKPTDGLGAYGAWVLVVVYQDPNETKARNVSIFDGYKTIDGRHSINISVNGFLTPLAHKVDSKLYSFVGEGDKNIVGDDFLMAGELHNTTLKSIAHNHKNAFNSSINILNTPRDPDLINNNGIDIQEYNVGTTSGALNIITNDEVGAKFQFTTKGDVYFPSLLVFSTEIYLPKMCYDYSVKQDNQYLKMNRAEYPEAQIDGKISSSNLEVTVYLRNMEADIPAEGIAIKSDVNDSVFDSIGDIYTSNVNGTALIDRGVPNQTNPLCKYDAYGDNSVSNNGCTNGHDIRKGNGTLKANQYVYTKFFLKPKNISGIADINESLGLSVRYYITINQHKSIYPDYILGSKNVPLCPTSNYYQAQRGIFNVIHRGQNSNITNNLFTQVSREPFDVSVIFDSTPENADESAPTSDVNTTVLVEMIDLDSFGDINASCAKPDSKVSDSIFVPINFTKTNYQADILTQPDNYYNVAVKNTAFRIWYFADNNDTLIENWHATTSDNNKHLISIKNLYNDSRFPLCKNICSDNPTTSQCFTCIKNNYAKPICSRDNFAIRPESYDIEIKDGNQSASLTKNNLSLYYDYSPNSQKVPTKEMQLVAGYKYSLDVTATGHDGLKYTPGYTRYFNGGSDYNATLIWDSNKTNKVCNDVTSKDITFYVNNGKLENSYQEHTNVGKYKFNIIDTSWTAVDWDWSDEEKAYRQSHNFTNTQDCILNSNSTLRQGYEIGCRINSNHGTVNKIGQPSYTYRDVNIIFHPYKFNLDGIVSSIGLNQSPVSLTSFVYMADINNIKDENMSYHLNGTIIAQGADNSVLNNFVDGCFAKPLSILINKNNDVHATVAYRYRLHTYDENNTQIRDTNANDFNTSNIPINFNTTDFTKSNNGKINTILNLNYSRNASIAHNPISFSFVKYQLNCTHPLADCTFSADLANDKTTKGIKDLNSSISIKYYYGRAHAQRQRYFGNEGNASIYYEVYDDLTNDGNKSLLQDRLNSKYTDDPRWFVNTAHQTARDGKVNSINQRGNTVGTGSVRPTLINTATPTLTHLKYYDAASKGYPYKTTMEINASNWLIYNKYNKNAKKNEFEVEFINSTGKWAGEHETDSTTKNNAADLTNRRLMW
ncbi:hypothetical protein [Sulfurimonas sp.]